jgi:PAS domain S-box-containing protein
MDRSFRDETPVEGTESDLSEKIATLEKRATEAESALHLILESSREAVLIHRHSIVEYVNPAFCELTGYSPKDLIGKNGVSIILHPDEVAELVARQKKSDAGEEVEPMRARWLTKAGAVLWTEGIRTIVEYKGAPAVIVRSRDITHEIESVLKREQAERSLRLTDERFRILFERSPIPVWIWDERSLDILMVNESARALYGYSNEEFLQLKLSDLRVPAELADLAGNVATLREKSNWRGIITHRKKDGSLFRLEVTAHAITVDGRAAMVSMGRDLTDLERMETQLRQSQKMDAVGQLAGGIAHDFNNILAVILAVADMMLLDLDEGHPFVDDVREIESAARRASALTHQLLAFSRQQPARPKNVALSTVVSEMEKLLARTVRENITMRFDLSSTGVIYADPSHLEQVLLNLVVNARDAMPNGGKLVIATADVELDESAAALLSVKPGRYQELSVTDTGCGMTPAVRARIFDPFFTTKEVGKGTGLGLTTVFGIVNQCGGGIAVDSAVGHGTTAKLVFPQVEVSADSIPARTKSSGQSAGSETILLVEDDETVRRVVSRVLRSNGYKVIEAADGNEALLQAQRVTPVDLLVSDLMMPNMDGRALGREITAKFPRMKLLFMSGHDIDRDENALLVSAERFISKPFTPAEMLTAIRGLLERSAD